MASSQLSGIAGILREAIRIPPKNTKLMLSVTIPWLLLYILLVWGSQRALQPLLADLVSKSSLLPSLSPLNPQFRETFDAIMKDTRIMVGLESFFLIILVLIFLFGSLAIIYVSGITLAGKLGLNLRELSRTIFKFQSWKRPLLTWSYVLLISLGYVLLVYLLIMGFIFVLDLKGAVSVAVAVVVALAAFVVWIYFSTVWKVALVISILEKECYGFVAIGRASDLIKERKFDGYVLMLILNIVCIVMATPYGFFVRDLTKIETRTWFQLVQTLVGLLFCLLSILSDMAFTVFYFECKKERGEKTELQNMVSYTLVPAAPHIDATLP